MSSYAASSQTATSGQDEFLDRYLSVRNLSGLLVDPLEPEDCVIQSMPDASPTRWHLAHTTWFFETFVLSKAIADYRPFDPAFSYLFNSYYNTIGEQFPRADRGLLSRPTLAEVVQYRNHVDLQMTQFLRDPNPTNATDWLPIVEIGLHHEQQHQELLLTDIKHVFSRNPLRPVYRPAAAPDVAKIPPAEWISQPEGIQQIGHDGKGFAYDNESPRHRVFIPAADLASRLVSNQEYLAFIEDDGYRRPELWLSDGWRRVESENWVAPLYWERQGNDWHLFTLSGMRKVNPAEPVCHVSYFEADAFARWSDASLPSESLWEVAARDAALAGNFVDNAHYHPMPLRVAEGRQPTSAHRQADQLFGDVWEWTSSPYSAYPGYRTAEGALGEYNGKFMCNQMVLRGGSCATARSHIRTTYRNFFPPEARWQFSGIRLCKDLS